MFNDCEDEEEGSVVGETRAQGKDLRVSGWVGGLGGPWEGAEWPNLGGNVGVQYFCYNFFFSLKIMHILAKYSAVQWNNEQCSWQLAFQFPFDSLYVCSLVQYSNV